MRSRAARGALTDLSRRHQQRQQTLAARLNQLQHQLRALPVPEAPAPGQHLQAGRPDLVTVRLGTAPPRPLGRIEDVDWHRFSPGGSATQEPQQSNQSRNQEERGQQQN